MFNLPDWMENMFVIVNLGLTALCFLMLALLAISVLGAWVSKLRAAKWVFAQYVKACALWCKLVGRAPR